MSLLCPSLSLWKYDLLTNRTIKDETGKSKGFAFVNYFEHEAASKAMEELNGKVFTKARPTTP